MDSPSSTGEKIIWVLAMSEGGFGGADTRDRAVQMFEPRPRGKGEGTVDANSEKTSMASSGRLWRKLAFQ